MDMAHINNAVPYHETLGGSQYVVILVYSASHLQRPYETGDKSTSAILGVVETPCGRHERPVYGPDIQRCRAHQLNVR